MRLAFILGRTCRSSGAALPRTAAHHAHPHALPHPHASASAGTRYLAQQHGGWQRQWRFRWSPPPPPGPHPRIVVLRASAGTAAAAGLGAAAFLELSQRDNEGTELTGERRMLEASRNELRQQRLHRNEDGVGFSGGDGRGGALSLVLARRMIGYIDIYVLEPILTALRLLHLATLFVPVVAAVPIMWWGERVPERDGEKRGTLLWYALLVKMMELAGPAFIKLGQWAASRSDIFPGELCAIMSKLHSNAPAHSMHATCAVIAAAFPGLKMADIFEEFDSEPVGVGAIAQVYRARLRPGLVIHDADMKDAAAAMTSSLTRDVVRNVENVLKSSPQRVPSNYVAVKIIHPGAERTVRRDLRIMGFFASVINAIPTMEWLSLPGEVEQFGEMMRLQLDLRIEAANLARFRRNFKDRTTAWFPYPFTELATRNVLVEEFAQGMPLADFINCGGGVFQNDIAGEGLDAFLRMVLLDNFVHADLHPGNIMVRFYQSSRPDIRRLSRATSSSSTAAVLDGDKPHPEDQDDATEQVLARLRPLRDRKDASAWLAELDAIDREGYRPQLIFIDTGLVTELSATNRANFLDLFRAIAEFDGYRAGVLMCERCRQPDAVIDKQTFALKMQNLILSVKSRTLSLGNVKIGDLLQEVLGMVRQHHVRLEGDFVNVVISILLLEGIGRSLSPDADLLSASLPILRQLSARGGAEMAKQGDFGLLVLWVGLETRRFLQASVEDVERCVKYDLLSPNV